jgi:acetyl-CoA acetyltransferase
MAPCDGFLPTSAGPWTAAKLPSVFKKGGSTTPGNASQVSDGAGRDRGAQMLGVTRHRMPFDSRNETRVTNALDDMTLRAKSGGP